MGKISKETRMKNYFKIFEQIYEFPTMSLNEIAATTELSRNSVSKYLKEMYARNILIGPHLRANPHANYKEYVYLMNFSDPWMVFKGLKGFPHVLYHAVAFGDWNTMVITNNPLDFSQLVGFHNVVYQGIRYCSYTPKPAHTTWNESLKKVCQQIAQGTPARIEYKSRKVALLTWQEDEWKLFHIFKYNMREKVTPLLKKIRVRYETYMKWMETVQDHCTIHTGFYPGGYQTYMSHCFLVSSRYESTVKSLFSLLPTTSFIMEISNQLLVFTSIPSSEMTRNLFCLIYHMRISQIIDGFIQAVTLFYCRQ